MSQATESRSVDRREVTRVDEPASPIGDLAPALDRTEDTVQSAQSAAGVEQNERVVTDEAGLQHRERTTHDVAAEYRQKMLKVSQVIWLLVCVIEGLIGLRVILKLIGANPDNDFARFSYNVAALFMGPFFGLTGSPSSGGMVLEVPSLIAMVLYGLLGWLIVRAILPLFDRATTGGTSTYDRHRS
jgi:YggT family protein